MSIAAKNKHEDAWQKCLDYLKSELSSLVFDTWIKPLQAKFEQNEWVLFAPNEFVKETIQKKYLPAMMPFLGIVRIQIGHVKQAVLKEPERGLKRFESNLNAVFSFD